jgi:hypothetical protein
MPAAHRSLPAPRTAILAIATLLGLACSRRPAEPPRAEPEPPVAGLPISLRVAQRTTTEIPGSDGRLRLTIDDITRGQVMITLLDSAGTPVVGPVSMRENDEQIFVLDGVRLRWKLARLDVVLVGVDHAEFVLDAAPAKTALAESEKIDRLIAAVERLENATFLRNGSEHDARDAARHLRRKLAAAGDEPLTAERFVEDLAARSSVSGEEYRVRFADGRVATLREFLRERLAAM